MARTILHADCNNFYASIEALHQPRLRGKPFAVCGDPALRHGIVLAKNYLAKATGIKTGNPIWLARRLCPELEVVLPNYPLYNQYAQWGRKIFSRFTDRIEPFGLDEAWLDVSGSVPLFGPGEHIADELRQLFKTELGITLSVGVSWNKPYAKLGSDLRKPDKTNVISRDTYRDTVWSLPVGALLYVGPSIEKRLTDRCINTIGDLAQCDEKMLESWLGKVGVLLSQYANGRDSSPVPLLSEAPPILSIGNSTTTPRDLVSICDVRLICQALSECVAERLRRHGVKGFTVEVYVRDSELHGYVKQGRLPSPSNLSDEIAALGMVLFTQSYPWLKPVRSFGVRVSGLVPDSCPVQLTMDGNEENRMRHERREFAIDDIRRRFGHFAIQRASMLSDRPLGSTNPIEDNISSF